MADRRLSAVRVALAAVPVQGAGARVGARPPVAGELGAAWDCWRSACTASALISTGVSTVTVTGARRSTSPKSPIRCSAAWEPTVRRVVPLAGLEALQHARAHGGAQHGAARRAAVGGDEAGGHRAEVDAAAVRV